jgi:hypothetical protein
MKGCIICEKRHEYDSGCTVTLIIIPKLTPWRRVLEKLISSQLLKKYPAFYGTQRFITTFTRACHLSLSGARSIQYMPPFPLLEDPFEYYPTIYVLVFQVGSSPQAFSPQSFMQLYSLPYMLHAPPI